jgi:hypothetical protein
MEQQLLNTSGTSSLQRPSLPSPAAPRSCWLLPRSSSTYSNSRPLRRSASCTRCVYELAHDPNSFSGRMTTDSGSALPPWTSTGIFLCTGLRRSSSCSTHSALRHGLPAPPLSAVPTRCHRRFTAAPPPTDPAVILCTKLGSFWNTVLFKLRVTSIYKGPWATHTKTHSAQQICKCEECANRFGIKGSE